MALFHTHALLSSGPDEQQNQTAWESSGSFGKPTQRPAASSLGTHAAPEAVSSAEWPAFLSLRLLSEQGRPRSGQHQPHRGGRWSSGGGGTESRADAMGDAQGLCVRMPCRLIFSAVFLPFPTEVKRRIEKYANQLFPELPWIFSQCETLTHVGRKRRCEYSNEFS